MAGHDHRYADCLYHARGDRPEQHARVSAPAAAANDKQLGRLRLVEKVMGRFVVHDNAPNLDVGIALLPAGQPLFEGCNWVQRSNSRNGSDRINIRIYLPSTTSITHCW